MANFSTPILDFEKLPPSLMDWVKPHLMKDEVVTLAIYEKRDDRQTHFRFYFLTSERLINLLTDYDHNKALYYYSQHSYFFLRDIYEVEIEARPDSHITGNVRYYEIKIRFASEGFINLSLEPKVAHRFESEVLNSIRLAKLDKSS